eukprot:2644660-Amphidinium_carterae.1
MRLCVDRPSPYVSVRLTTSCVANDGMLMERDSIAKHLSRALILHVQQCQIRQCKPTASLAMACIACGLPSYLITELQHFDILTQDHLAFNFIALMY